MGFWDSELIDLRLAGVRLDKAEVDILEHGGNVVALTPLPDPATYQGAEYLMYDANDKVVHVPIVISCSPPEQVFYQGQRPGDTMTMIEQLDAELGLDWRRHPAYVGEMLWDDSDRWGDHFVMWAEELRAYRPWSCRPLVTAADEAVLHEIQEATRRRLNDADWFLVDQIFSLESDENFIAETACIELGAVKAPEGYQDPYAGMVDYAGYGYDMEYLRAVCAGFAELCNARRYFTWSWDPAPHEDVESFVIPPMEDYLEPGSPAWSFWFSTLARKYHTHAKIKRLYHRNDKYDFDNTERWIA